MLNRGPAERSEWITELFHGGDGEREDEFTALVEDFLVVPVRASGKPTAASFASSTGKMVPESIDAVRTGTPLFTDPVETD